MPDWERQTIGQALREAASLWGDREALAAKNERLTYAELYQRAGRLALGLSRLGVGKGDHVATIFGTGTEWVVVKYALHILGAVIVPLNVTFRSDELAYALKQADVKTLIMVDELRQGNYVDILGRIDPGLTASTGPELVSDVLPELRRVVCFSPDGKRYDFAHDLFEVLASGSDFTDHQADAFLAPGRPDDPCNILFTSGSTARPKGVVHVHRSLLGIAEHLYGRSWNLEPGHRLLSYLPFYHIGGCVYAPLGALMRGCFLYVNDFVPEEIMALIEQERICNYGGFDFHFHSVENHPRFKDFDLGSVRFVLLAVGPEGYDNCRKVLPGAEIVTHHYGFTEGTGVSHWPEERDEQVRKYTNGRPWPGIEVKVVDPVSGETVPPNQPGELCLRGWNRFQEYYKNPEETAKAIDPDGFFHSGDYGWMDEKGNVVYRGRYKMMIKSGGENVSEREVEIFLESLPGVKSVQVIGLPDDKWGEAVTAVIEPDPGADLTREAVVEYCRDRIANFKIPKHVLFFTQEEWPLLGAGKVSKIELKKMALDRLGVSEGQS
ncbi:MAG: AMP-binding protein [Proteobacteria bacterium]|nr:AMP-binding protein [Pseudomonadota bacterium]